MGTRRASGALRGGVRVVDDPAAQSIHADFRIDVDLVERTLKAAGLW